MKRSWTMSASAVVLALAVVPSAHAQTRLNPVIDLVEKNQPVFGLYIPANPRARPGAAAPAPETVKSPAALASDAVAFKRVDYMFDGSMENNFDAALANFSEFAKALDAAGALQKGKSPRFTHGMFVKTPEIAPDPALAATRIAKQLNEGVTGIMFVSVESAEEVKQGIAAMRFKSKGGTRPDDVGSAPARWGMTEKEYKEKADLYPLNPKGELYNFTVVESEKGLANVREIAAVKGVGVLFPGAGTLRQLFSKPDASGQRKLDEVAWEAAIQKVLAACKEFHTRCGYPAGAPDIELRMKQGFDVFVSGWGEQGFKAVEIGRGVAGR